MELAVGRMYHSRREIRMILPRLALYIIVIPVLFAGMRSLPIAADRAADQASQGAVDSQAFLQSHMTPAGPAATLSNSARKTFPSSTPTTNASSSRASSTFKSAASSKPSNGSRCESESKGGTRPRRTNGASGAEAPPFRVVHSSGHSQPQSTLRPSRLT